MQTQPRPATHPLLRPKTDLHRSCAAVALDRLRRHPLGLERDQVEYSLRPLETLQLEVTGRLRRDDVLDLGEDAQADQDLAVRRGVAEAGGHVDDGADGPVVEAPLGADAAERGVAARDADAEAELIP